MLCVHTAAVQRVSEENVELEQAVEQLSQSSVSPSLIVHLCTQSSIVCVIQVHVVFCVDTSAGCSK